MVQPGRGELRQPLAERDHRLRRGFEKRVVIGQLRHLRRRRLDQFRPAIARRDTPQPGHAVEDLCALIIVQKHAVRAGDDAHPAGMQRFMVRERVQMVGRIQPLPIDAAADFIQHVETPYPLENDRDLAPGRWSKPKHLQGGRAETDSCT
jgi:hypothetical protein